jgi:hypothetical protein
MQKKIFNWIVQEVIPSLRKYGEYKLTYDIKKKIKIRRSKY